MLSLCHELHQDNGLFEMEDAKVREMLDRAYNRQGGVIGIIDGDGEIAGAIYMTISSMWYRSPEHLEELFNFVRPKYRNTKAAKALVQFAKTCSDKTGLPLMIGVVTNKRLEAKVRLYRQELGMPAGAFFLYGVKQWANESVMDQRDLWRVHRGKKHGNGRAEVEIK
jgi:GNAT superfamily N-acetyltransferase